MQYKVKYLCYNDRKLLTFAEYMERILNEFGKEGWKPIHISTISETSGYSDAGTDVDTWPHVLITFAKE